MLQVARLAPNLLQEAAEGVGRFVREQFNEDGGTRDRAGESDLYYTVFGLETLIALRQDPPADRVVPFLRRFGDGAELDLVHLTCLARCWAALPKGSLDAGTAGRIADRIRRHRAADGGFGLEPGQEKGSLYHSFLAVGALQDLGAEIADPEKIGACLGSLQRPDGSYGNAPGVPAATTPTTAGAVTLLRNLRLPVPPASTEWLLQRALPAGGFVASPETPIPDLLSTATALHALAGQHASLSELKESLLDFIDTLWTGKAFCGNWADDEQDCEYTYYGLLSLGHLSLA